MSKPDLSFKAFLKSMYNGLRSFRWSNVDGFLQGLIVFVVSNIGLATLMLGLHISFYYIILSVLPTIIYWAYKAWIQLRIDFPELYE